MVGADLQVTVSGGDAWLLALRRQWSVSVPLSAVYQAGVRPPLGAFTRRHLAERADPRLRVRGRLVCARRRGRVLELSLEDGPYRLMVLSVPEPDEAAAAITASVKARPR